MLYTIRAGSSASGGFFIAAGTVREALNHARALEERGLSNVHVLDGQNQLCDLATLASMASSDPQPAIAAAAAPIP